jgi:thymidylate synthase
MRQYLDVVRQILDRGTRKENRTGVDTLSTFGLHYDVDLRDGFPLLTTKAMSWKNIVVEMLWFLSGRTDIGILRRHDCRFWNAWADAEGRVPSAYGSFWRHFPVHRPNMVVYEGEYVQSGNDATFNDQIQWAVEELRRNPMSRRVAVSAWAPGNAQASKLPPCHCLFVLNVQNVRRRDAAAHEVMPRDRQIELERFLGQYPADCGCVFVGQERAVACNEHHPGGVTEPRLCLHLTQRSCDIALGVPYNLASYALLLELFSRFTGIVPGTFSHTLVDAHAYTAKPDGSAADHDHVPGLREQIARDPRPLPRIRIDERIRDLADVERLMGDDVSTEEVMRHFVLEGYDPHPAIPFKVAV